MRRILNLTAASLVAAVLALGAGGVMAMGGGGGGGAPVSPKSTYAQAVEKVKAKDFASAILLLRSVVAQEPRNADAFNYLGFSYRESGDLEQAMENYRKALAIEPDHKGANEYLGELYVRLGDLPNAEAQLAKLDRLCTFGCAEYEELKRKVAALRRSKGS